MRKLCEISDHSRHKCNTKGKIQWLAEFKESWHICKLCRETCGQSSEQNERKKSNLSKATLTKEIGILIIT